MPLGAESPNPVSMVERAGEKRKAVELEGGAIPLLPKGQRLQTITMLKGGLKVCKAFNDSGGCRGRKASFCDQLSGREALAAKDVPALEPNFLVVRLHLSLTMQHSLRLPVHGLLHVRALPMLCTRALLLVRPGPSRRPLWLCKLQGMSRPRMFLRMMTCQPDMSQLRTWSLQLCNVVTFPKILVLTSCEALFTAQCRIVVVVHWAMLSRLIIFVWDSFITAVFGGLLHIAGPCLIRCVI